MASKTVFIFCVQAIFIKFTFSQCLSPAFEATRYGTPYGLPGPGYGYDSLAYDGLAPFGVSGRLGIDNLALGCGIQAMEITPTSGGSLSVTSGSAIPPVGVSVVSENMYEGILAAAGELPFVGIVGVEGGVPTAGAAGVNYGCGNGVTAMESVVDVYAPGFGTFGLSFIPAAGITPAAGVIAPAYGYTAQWATSGVGCM